MFYGWILVCVLGVTTIISYGSTSYAFGVLIVPITKDLGWSRAELSGALSLSILLAGVLGLPVGHLVDRYGARVLMTVGSSVTGLVLIALASVHEVWQFDLLWGLGLGLGTALTYYSVSFTVVANWFQQRRGAALAWLTTLGGLASVTFIPLTAWLVPQLGWRSAVIVLGLINLAIALPLHLFVLRRHPEDLGLRVDGQSAEVTPPLEADGKKVTVTPLPAADRTKAAMSGLTAREALAGSAFWLLTLAAGLDQLSAMVVWAHQIAFSISRGFDPVFAAGIASIIGIMSLPGRFLLNQVSDRIDPQRVLALVLLTMGLGIALLTMATTVWLLYAYVVVYGIAFGARSPLRASVMAEHFGRRAYGAITAAQGIVVAVPAAFGPLAAGWLYDRLGNYQLAFWLTALGFAAAAATVYLTPRPAGKSAGRGDQEARVDDEARLDHEGHATQRVPRAKSAKTLSRDRTTA